MNADILGFRKVLFVLRCLDIEGLLEVVSKYFLGIFSSKLNVDAIHCMRHLLEEMGLD